MVIPKSLVSVIRKVRTATSSSTPLSTSSICSSKGHFVVYTIDNRRFVMPLKFMKRKIMVQLLKMAEEEFGFSSDQPIVFPFNGHVMDQIIMFLSSSSSPHFSKDFGLLSPDLSIVWLT
ncbi:Auxin-responsive protein SAUR36 [Linum perenne]